MEGVTLRVRVWIETDGVHSVLIFKAVTLRVRVWIETDPDIYSIVFEVSPSA